MTPPNISLLDNPIWHALTGLQANLGVRLPAAARFDKAVSPFAGLDLDKPEAIVELRKLFDAKDTLALFTPTGVELAGAWAVDRAMTIEQMVLNDMASIPAAEDDIVPLGEADAAQMLELTGMCKPGPFLPKTYMMGNFYGVKSADGKLVSMAGQRLSVEGFTEISAVCTHPDFRGKGYSRVLIMKVAAEIFARGKMPFLHVAHGNDAKFLYEKIGFKVRKDIHLTVLSAV
ncbi:MAG: GNAT family N-acetyltransferase [Micavibrio sp.]|nr:GNAT family N-acetyltransferase [Micavibrio sp.]